MIGENFTGDVRALIETNFQAAQLSLSYAIDDAWRQTHAIAEQLRAPALEEVEALKLLFTARDALRTVDACFKAVIDARLDLASAQQAPPASTTWAQLPDAEGPN